MREHIDWEHEQARANQHTQRSLIALARRAGFEVSTQRGKGSHVTATLPGIPRPVVIAGRMNRRSAQRVLNQLRRALEGLERDS